MDRGNHYETAFEAYLRQHRLGYVPVDETKRVQWGDVRLKSLDFIVHGDKGARLLVDVKGRRYPAGTAERPRKVWECWSTVDDIRGLDYWSEQFGPGYRGLLVFVYQLLPEVVVSPATADLWEWRGRRYLLRAVTVDDYKGAMRWRSRKWDTVSLPGAVYRRLARPFLHYLQGLETVPEQGALDI